MGRADIVHGGVSWLCCFLFVLFGIVEKTRCFRRKLFEIQKAFKSMMIFHDLMDLCFKSSSLKSQFFDGVIF